MLNQIYILYVKKNASKSNSTTECHNLNKHYIFLSYNTKKSAK